MSIGTSRHPGTDLLGNKSNSPQVGGGWTVFVFNKLFLVGKEEVEEVKERHSWH